MLRNPRTLNAAFFNSMFVALLVLALYFNVGDIDDVKTEEEARVAT